MTSDTQGSGTVSVREAADLLHLKAWNVWHLCRRGALASQWDGPRLLVGLTSVRAYKESK